MGIVGLTYSCAVALQRYGVTTNAISPAAATRMTATIRDDAYSSGATELSPDSIAPIAAYLASEQSGWCNGHVIHARGYKVSLYSDPEPLVTVRSEGPWDLNQMAKEVERSSVRLQKPPRQTRLSDVDQGKGIHRRSL